MSWIHLMLAILFEVSGTTCMKLSQGFSRLIPSILIFVFYGCSFTFMTMAIRRIDVSIVYAIWSGLGTAIIATIGIFVFKEPATLLKLVSMMLIIIGVITLNLNTAAH